tara:strand:- start:661243 stop:662265 length:1023 start_codon:yes stop_codon:yes gene_type:complete
MRIFVGEYICGGGLADQSVDDVPDSLRLEGAAMLRSIVEDVSQFADAVVPLDQRLGLEIDAAQVIPTQPPGQLWAQWVAAARDCDAAVVVIPESGGLLAQGVAMLRASGVDVVAGSGDFLRVASDKWQTAKTLHESGISHPLSMITSDNRFETELRQLSEFVVKPRDGCASQDIQCYDSFDDAVQDLADDQMLQAKVPGQSISVSLIASGSQQTFLPAVRQTISVDTFSYAGGSGPLDTEAQRRATALASHAVSAMPPTVRGFVGIDLILGDTPSDDYVIEINPRFSTSYVGLRRMIRGNLAARLFDIETGPVTCAAAKDSVRWSADGQVWVNDMAINSA